ncbi:MAG: elongation factor Ts [Deltaproteobacteria bacterium CG12_big_fil_rev_8_21_14_0_65_43_10]|nr:MAG: elongation factor Ts [Deltaproteobacteria bacterium CG2_30_43_15]PIQ45284.1 MAG: elongation factor Ts [Deltaproteobacteria bacterium CG12_big_fil_rev_8_21_14_0_65_43_10]PIU86609.1 MAG: elongation factor Ts [Deltaproteobacteria bacterium CG06_land_8_20_14_3_00_44_19]PIX23102.1 MAG: elongation factor Ts [Deltaproteobacteria bacterium CG_4_8_14_3_um_filter_43_13]PIZ20312.1 MAG: elongation factor Ts [Deltaproteobacteria bacterium CG_4_10_14_0_8_um_filter_43_12]PJB41987.1 MAG: elongation fa
MEIKSSVVKSLREKTSAGIMDCKKALEETRGDIDKAIDYLRKKGLAAAAKKTGRISKEGIIEAYIHPGGKLGVLVEVNCETDFVAKAADFVEFVKNIAMHIAASNPLYLKREFIPEDVIEKEREIYKSQALNSGKPEKIIDRIVDGKIEKYFCDVCLLEQPYVKEPELSVKELVDTLIAKMGENISIRRFSRYQLSENLDNEKA